MNGVLSPGSPNPSRGSEPGNGQAQAERIEGRRTEVALETGGKVGPPGREVKDAQAQVERIHARAGRRWSADGRVATTGNRSGRPALPGWGIAGGGQPEWQQRSHGFPAEQPHEIGDEQTPLSGREDPGLA